MPVSGVSSTAGATAAERAVGYGQLDRNAFLKLLITQLQNQDPMKPIEDKEFIAQLAQFSSLEQMQQMNDSFGQFSKNGAAGHAFAMIGREVDYADAELGTLVNGTVESVSLIDGSPRLNIGDKQVPVANVITVY